jgi:iron complex transport system permease protein
MKFRQVSLRQASLHSKMLAGTLMLSGLLVLAVVVSAGQGPAPVSYASVVAVLLNRLGLPAGGFTPVDQQIVEQIRLPRILTGALVGYALGVSGAVLQGLFRNPLADPGIIGVSSGGALGAVLAISTGVASSSLFSLPLAAFVGALGVAFSVYGIGAGRGQRTLMTVVLAGIALAALTSAVSALAISLTEDRDRNRAILFWLMGGLDNRSWEHVGLIVLPVLLGSSICIAFGRELNLMLLGEEPARSLGVSVGAARAILLAVVAAVTAAAVAVSGIINFVGLMIPHAVRLVVGYDHRLVVPFSGLAAATFLVVADIAARTLTQPAEIRVGIVTSVLGAPFFIHLIVRQRRDRLPI